MGLKSQDTAELFFNNVKVPKENLLGEWNKGFLSPDDDFLAGGTTARRRLVTTPNADVAFDLTMDYVQERKAFGQTIANFQNTRFKLGETCALQIDIAQAYIDQCVHGAQRGQADCGRCGQGEALYCSELEGRVMDDCVQLHGGAGYMDEYPICRHVSECARVSRIYAGTF